MYVQTDGVSFYCVFYANPIVTVPADIVTNNTDCPDKCLQCRETEVGCSSSNPNPNQP